MSQIAIDPIGYSDALQKAGMPKEQADIIARTQEATLDTLLEAKGLADERDLKELEYNLHAQITESRNELELALMRARSDMIRWMIGLITGLGAFLVAVMPWLK